MEKESKEIIKESIKKFKACKTDRNLTMLLNEMAVTTAITNLNYIELEEIEEK